MKSVNVAELKNNLSKYLVEVKRGEEVLIKDRNKPIAKIIPLHFSDDEEAELLQLVAEGKAKMPTSENGLSEDFFKAKLPKVKADVVQYLREERDER